MPSSILSSAAVSKILRLSFSINAFSLLFYLLREGALLKLLNVYFLCVYLTLVILF